MHNAVILSEPSDWDLVWTERIAQIEQPHEPNEPKWLGQVALFEDFNRFGMFSIYLCKDYIRLLRALKRRRVLIGGNGVNLYGDFLAHCGLEVTTVDFSPVAVEFARSHPASDTDWVRFHQWPGPLGSEHHIRVHPEALDKARAVRARWHRRGGRLEHVLADLRTMTWDTFDAVILRKTLDRVGPDSRKQVLELCYRHLPAGGLLFAEGSVNHLITFPEEQAEPEITLEEIVRKLGFTVFNRFSGEWDLKERFAPATVRPDGRLRGWWGAIVDAVNRGEKVALLDRPR